MRRKPITLGISLTMVFALSAFAASAGQADGEKEDARINLTVNIAVVVGAHNNVHILDRAGRTVDCESGSSEAEVEDGATTVALASELSGCTSAIGPATVDMGGCQYVAHLKKTTTTGPDDYSAVADLACPEGEKIHVKIYTSHTNHTGGQVTCEYTFSDTHEGEPVNQGLEMIELFNEPAGGETPVDWVRADFDIGGVVSTRTAGSALICGPFLDEAGTLEGEASLKAEDAEEEPVGGTIGTDAE